MFETKTAADFPVSLFGRGLVFLGGDLFVVLPDCSLYFEGSRPGPEWHRHGTTLRRPRTLREGRVHRIVVWKQRWKHRETGETTHSRPPDDVPQIWSCSLILTLWLFARVAAEAGLHNLSPPLPSLERAARPRTVARWMARALPLAQHSAQALRHQLIEMCEPRPWEDILRKTSGIPPPQRRGPRGATTLRESLNAVLSVCRHVELPLARLLAGARGRWTGPEPRFLI